MSEEQAEYGAETKKRKMPTKQRVFIDRYLVHFNATRAATEAGYSEATAYSSGQRLLKDVEIAQEIEARLKEKHASADEVIGILADHARSDIGVFFKLVEEWTFYPLPTYEILGEKEVIDDTDQENPKTRISYWVRHVCIDTDKLVDPRYSHLLREFSDSPKNGISIKLHDKQSAIDKILRVAGRYKDNSTVLNIDMSTLTNSQLERLAKGEDVYTVLATPGEG